MPICDSSNGALERDDIEIPPAHEPADVANMALYLCSPFGATIIRVFGDVRMLQ